MRHDRLEQEKLYAYKLAFTAKRFARFVTTLKRATLLRRVDKYIVSTPFCTMATSEISVHMHQGYGAFGMDYMQVVGRKRQALELAQAYEWQPVGAKRRRVVVAREQRREPMVVTSHKRQGRMTTWDTEWWKCGCDEVKEENEEGQEGCEHCKERQVVICERCEKGVCGDCSGVCHACEGVRCKLCSIVDYERGEGSMCFECFDRRNLKDSEGDEIMR